MKRPIFAVASSLAVTLVFHAVCLAGFGDESLNFAPAPTTPVAGDQATLPPVQPPAIASLNEPREGRGVPSLR